MNKKVIAAAATVGALGLGGMIIWHHNGHPGLDHGHGDAASHDHSHDHAGGENVKLELNDGKKWATDEPLRKGMDILHKEVIPLYKAYNDKSLTEADAKAYAGTIRAQIDFFFKNCSLEPKADAVLHIVLAELIRAAGVLEKEPLSEEGIPAVVNALHSYEAHFDHPNF